MTHPADDTSLADPLRDRRRRDHCGTCKAITSQFVNTMYVNITTGVKVALSYICLPCGAIIDCDNKVANKYRQEA